MSSIIANTFTAYQLTDEETIVGSIYTIGQREVLQNQLAVTAELKIVLEYDVSDPMTFVQEEARLKGWIECLRHLLDTSQGLIESRQPQTPEDQQY